MTISESGNSYIRQRQAPRHREDKTVWIDTGDGSSPQKCTLWDASDAGVRITIDTPQTVPYEFYLLRSKDGKDRKRCRVRWRSLDQIGASFVPA